jgi:NADH-quinone oxidoreductase subunit C
MAELTNELVAQKLKAAFGDAILQVEEPYALVTLTVNRNKIIDILKFLRDDQELGLSFLTDLTGVHYAEPDEQLGVVYHLHNMAKNFRVRIKSFFPKSDPIIATATGLWPAANWMERETFDFYGINFTGHPNLKRILNVDDLGYFPMRKEYALEDPTREDKDDRFFGRDAIKQ